MSRAVFVPEAGSGSGTNAPVNFTCINWATGVSAPCDFQLASIMPNRAYYEITALRSTMSRRRYPDRPARVLVRYGARHPPSARPAAVAAGRLAGGQSYSKER